jgi:hypothetical protein
MAATARTRVGEIGTVSSAHRRSGRAAVRRAIRIGRQNAEVFEVLQGLEPGEKVVTSGYEDYEKIDKLVLGN